MDTSTETLDPRHHKKYYLHATPVRKAAIVVTRALFSLVGDRHTQGAENLPASGPVILAANHLTNFDVFPLQYALPRTIFYMGKAELYRNPALDWLLRQLGSFPVHRGERDAWAMEHAEKVLRSGQVLGIFPEGSRSKGRGLHTAKTGAARLAQKIGCPIVPAAIHGTQYMFRHFPRRTPVRIKIGAPIYQEPGETLLSLTDRMMFTLAEMLPPEARGVYAYRPPGF